jgi:hypothetical protein
MSEVPDIDRLTDREVFLVLGHLTTELGEQGKGGAPAAVDEQEAREALASFLESTGEASGADAARIVPGDADAAALGRALLARLLQDDVAGEPARALVADPPDDDQMVLELALGAAVILGTLITWLQTKVDVSVKREDGKTSWSFELHKDATDPEVIKQAAATVGSMMTPGAGGAAG